MEPAPINLLLKLPETLLAQVDFSANACAEKGIRPWVFEELGQLIAAEMEAQGALVLWGGYLEHRAHYQSSELFQNGGEARNIHLGLDFWANAGTAVHAPWDGVLHSQKDNAQHGDYGPTLVLSHRGHGREFHSLYGHLSRASLHLHKPGDMIPAGTLLGWMGIPEENVGWQPHLHFQLILDLGGHVGDYPGVCSQKDLAFYTRNCPDPTTLVGL